MLVPANNIWFKYCPHCGVEGLKGSDKSNPDYLFCSSCGIFYNVVLPLEVGEFGSSLFKED